MDKFRVLHISLTKSIGGIASYQRNLLDYIDRERFCFDYVTTYPQAMLLPYLEENGATVHRLPPQKTVIPYCIKLYRVLKNGHYDAVHIHKNSCANPMAFLMARLAGVKKIIAHSHSTTAIGGKMAVGFHFLFRPLVRKISTVHLACSKSAAAWLYGEPNDAVIVQNGIDLAKFAFDEEKRRQMRAELGVGDSLLFGHVGNFIAPKNHRFMIEIMAQVVKTEPTAKLLFAGRGDLMDEMKHYAKQCGVENNILFLGSRPDVDKLYQAMDALLFPSLHEGLPIAGLEAQAAGLPCLFSDGVTDEILVTDDARIYPLRNTAAQWAEQLIQMAKDGKRPQTAEAIARAGFDARQSTQTVENIYTAK